MDSKRYLLYSTQSPYFLFGDDLVKNRVRVVSTDFGLINCIRNTCVYVLKY